MRLAAFGAALALVAAFGVAACTQAEQPTASPPLAPESSVLTSAELGSAGIEPYPIPAGAPAPRISAEDAVVIAARQAGRNDEPAEVLHAMVPPDASSSPRSSYVVIFLGGRDIPGGPAGELHPVKAMVIAIDDQTGQFLTGSYIPAVES